MTAHCIGCRALITFNPARVPSIVVDGTRLPVCCICAQRANEARSLAGRETFVIYEDSYADV